jgi:hypothetical protein
MPKKPTAADAQLILQLYDLRRESEMRKARSWIAADFHPKNAGDVLALANAFGSQENAWFRQVLGYWDMAASLVLRGALNPELFFDNAGEMFFIYAKLRPFVKELRESLKSPELLLRIEKVVTASKAGRDRLKRVEERLASMSQRAAAAAANKRA